MHKSATIKVTTSEIIENHMTFPLFGYSGTFRSPIPVYSGHFLPDSGIWKNRSDAG
ncbi:MAG: hypothetical protein MUP98_02210 [Candidatus Aminicenantes bacterium]|nr:hypothetical protein [Candidatus Aminicenantes bacterium]